MKRVRAGVVAVGLSVGLAVVGLGVARAQSTDEPGNSTTTTAPAAPEAKDPAAGKFKVRRFGPGPMGFGKFGGGAIHGEVTSPKEDGGYRTMAFQTGEVTSVSKSEVALKSEDGFTRTYKLDEDTLVNAGRDGIDNVKNGDKVKVMAVVEGNEARAVHVVDATNIERSRQRWAGRPRN
jgi:hypothetical protein